MSFQLLSTIKVKLVDEKMQNAYLCVILLVKHKKKYHLSRLQRAPGSNTSEYHYIKLTQSVLHLLNSSVSHLSLAGTLKFPNTEKK